MQDSSLPDGMKPSHKDSAVVPDTLWKESYALVKDVASEGLDAIAAELGEVIHVTDVKVNPKSRALVTSARALDFHTDHARADYVAWLCIDQADDGGETILADAEAAYLRLSPGERHALSGIHLREHKVFADDEDFRPLVIVENGEAKFYYSFWLVEDNLSSTQKDALTRFRRILSECQIAEIKLRPDDVLVVDNARILHGRRAFSGEKRFLKRYWISRYPSINAADNGDKP